MINPIVPLLLGALSVSAYPSYPAVADTTNTNSSIAVATQPFEVVIVFVEPEGGCAAQCNPNKGQVLFESGKLGASAHQNVYSTNSGASGQKNVYATKSKPAAGSPTKSADQPLFTQAGVNSQLPPSVHWNTDTTPATNVIPVPVGKGSQFYHGNSEPTQAGYFGFLTYFFSSPSVNLDHCAHVSNVNVGPSGFDITFASTDSYDYALQHWSAKDGLILIVYSESCPGFKAGERCYLVVTGITYNGNTAVVTGEYCHDTNEIIDSGETEWGWWVPRYNGTALPSGSASSTVRPSVSWTGGSPTKAPGISTSYIPLKPTGTSGSGPKPSGASSTFTSGRPFPTLTPGFNSTVPGTNSTSGGSSPQNTTTNSGFTHLDPSCVAPVDTKYGLPTACLGALFDKDLDNALGYYDKLDADALSFINYLAPDADDNATPVDPSVTPKRSLMTRQQKLDMRGWPCLSCALQSVGNFIAHPVDTLVKLKDTIQEATSISGSINKDLAFKLPDPANAESSKLQDKTTKQVTSPWGDSVLLKAFGTQGEEGAEAKEGLHGFMNVFCVGCGVSGHANVAGRASWTPLGGIIKGEVEMNADVQFIFKLGIDAQMTYSKTFENDLLRLGLPGLTYGIVTIGPWVEVKSKVALEANAQGRLLAGAEVGLTAAHVLIDFINPSNSKKDGWEPYFKPVFEAEGELMLSAELGLPMAIKCGLQIASFSKSVGIIDEPSIKGVAQVAASVGLTASGSFSAGFKETNGCTGISTQLTWRNKLYIDVLGLTTLGIFDTNDKKLAQACIALPGLPAPPATTPPATTDPSTDPSPPATDPSTDPTTDPSANPSTEPSTDPSTDPSTNPSTDPSPPASDPSADPPATTDPTADPNAGQSGGDGSSDTAPVDSAPVDPTPVESAPEVAPEAPVADDNTVYRRADVTSNSTVIDRTASVNSTATSLSYSPQAFPNVPYNDTEGYSYQLLTVSDGSMIFVACGNGGIYGVSPDSADNAACAEMWATHNDILVADATQRLLHFYSNTMNATGVSRLRLANEESVPEGSQLVVFTDAGAGNDTATNDTTDDAFYVAIDQDLNIFYPVLCTYTDGGVSRLFVVKDPVAGVETLQSPDVKFSITGGVVGSCYVIPMFMGAWAGADYNSYDSAIDPETDTLYFD